MKKIIFGLGSNFGNRRYFLDQAIKNLFNYFELENLKQSQIIENKALLLPGSPIEWDMDFYNLTISADIDLEKFPPMVILRTIKNIENNLGRINRGLWAPREIDIDILAIEDLWIESDDLKIPHRQILNRQFCIDGFREIEPDLFEVVKSLLALESNK